jgi:hypothetical protein
MPAISSAAVPPAPGLRTHVPVEGDDGDDVAGPHPAPGEAGGEPPHAVGELRAGEPAAAA